MVEKLARSEDLENKAKTICESDDVVSEALEEIVTGTEKVNTLLGEISSASKEQSVGINEVNTGVAELDKVTQQNAGNAEELASAA